MNAIELTWYLKDAQIALVYFFDKPTDEEYLAYKKVAEEGEDEHQFLATNDHVAAWTYGIGKLPALMIYWKYDEHNVFFKKEWNTEAIKKFI